MSKWTASDIANLSNQGKIKYTGDLFPEKKKKKNVPSEVFKKKPEGLVHIDWVLFTKSLKYENEKYFVPGRDFRSDRYVPSLNLLIEYEGIYSETSRHTHFSGYSTDCEKYNYANALGYKLLRFTADNYKQFTYFLEKIMNNGS